ncbi:MAG: aminotransferase [Paenibacillaceae bacterium]|nr:aminotransferase [Paenibacillaceae bacterium]
MSEWNGFDRSRWEMLYPQWLEQYEQYQSRHLALDMTRGKPCPEQLDLAEGMLNIVGAGDSMIAENGTDIRNYGGLDGLPEAKRLFAEMLGVRPQQVAVGGNSSLAMMHDTVFRAMQFGLCDSPVPWGKLPKVKFLCPSPGYDRHFAICELFGIEMIVVDMLADGPDMDQVERLVGEDEAIKAIWCVPRYGNPTGITYSDGVVNRLAAMKTKAGDFKVIWDDAYIVHHLTDKPEPLKNMMEACESAGHPDRVLMFCSTSKISFSGSGVAAMAASENNLRQLAESLGVQTIGPDKINQLRHVRFFGDLAGIHAHMQRHAAIIKPKFDAVLNKLESDLGGSGMAEWTTPIGGYFISLNTLDGCAREVVQRAAEVGVTLTKAGATFPYGRDPRDRNIRIAPTFPSLADVHAAMDVLCLCIKLVSVEMSR